MLPERHAALHVKCYQEASLMHRILFTVIHSHMRLLPMMAAEGGMMINCVQGVEVGGTTPSRGETEGKLGFKYSTG